MNAPVPRAAARKELRIGYIFSQFPVPTETFAVSDVCALLAQDHDVSVFTMKPAPGGEGRLRRIAGVPADLRVLRPTIAGGLRWPLLLWRYRRAAFRLASAALRAAPRTPATALGALLCIPRAVEIADAAQRSGLDVVHIFWSRHGGMVLPVLELANAACVRSAFVGAYDLVADDFLVPLTLRSANVVFSHAEANRDFAQSRAKPGVPVQIVRRGIPLPSLGPDAERDRFCWITASALTEAKNPQGVVRAFALARKQDARLRLVVCGDGPQRGQLERLAGELGIASSVEFAGHVSRGELFGRLSRASVFLLLSKKPSERLPNVVKEALWAGCAVVCAPSEGIEELIPSERIGSIVDPDDHEAIARAGLAAVAEADADAAIRRAEAREFIETNFSAERSMANYVEAWHRVATAREFGKRKQRQVSPAS